MISYYKHIQLSICWQWIWLWVNYKTDNPNHTIEICLSFEERNSQIVKFIANCDLHLFSFYDTTFYFKYWNFLYFNFQYAIFLLVIIIVQVALAVLMFVYAESVREALVKSVAKVYEASKTDAASKETFSNIELQVREMKIYF